jgi:type IV pilus assembly protein PilC
MGAKIKSGAFLSAFCTELAMIIETGIPISDGLLMLIDDEESEKSKKYIANIYEETKDGGSFSAAAEKSGGFPKYALDMFVIGEKTGRLDSVLRSLAIYYDRDTKIKESIKSAVIFPLLLFTLLLAVMWILLTQVLPVFEDVFGQLGISLSSSAGRLMQIGIAIESSSIVILLVFAVIAVSVFITYKIDALRECTKRMFSKLLKNSALMQSLLAARFTASMAMTLKSGLDIDSSLELALAFAPNKHTADKISQCRKAVADGKTFNDAVLETGILSPIYCRMLALSFKTGSTDEIMELIAEKSEEEAAVSIERLIGRIEPAMALVMSLLIGLVLLSVMFPLLAVMSS